MQQIWQELLAWWESLSGTEQSLLVFLVAVVAVFVSLFSGRSKSTNQTIHIGITLEEHEQRLKRREVEVHAELEQAHAADRHVLETELRVIEQQLQDTQASYEAYFFDLKERISQLKKLRGEFPDTLLNQAIEALQQGETDKVDSLFQQIEDEGEGHIKRVAEAAFQRGKIAKDAIRYADALEHYEKAVGCSRIMRCI